MNDRINDLKNLLKNDPDDPFLHYALGLEYNKLGLLNRAIYEFELLLKKFPDYLPVYYQAAHLYMEMGDLYKAKDTFKNGMLLAKSVSELKTFQELSNAYNNFLIDLDDH